MICGKVFAIIFHVTPPGLASSFLVDRNFSKGASFPTIFSGVGPSKNCVSIFFTRLLHRPRPLPGSLPSPHRNSLFRDCTISPNNLLLRITKLNAIGVTQEAIFECLVLVPGPRHVFCHRALGAHTPLAHGTIISRSPCLFAQFGVAPQFFCQPERRGESRKKFLNEGQGNRDIRFNVSGGDVGVVGMEVIFATDLHPETEYKRSKIAFTVTCIALTFASRCTKLLEPLVQSLIGSPVPSSRYS